MADVTIGGATYNGVEQVDIPLASGAGKASFFLNGGSAFVPYNINLLDNADWGYGLVNQRGITQQTTGSGQKQPSFDRWVLDASSSISVSSSAVTFAQVESYMIQRLEILPEYLSGKNITVAVEDETGIHHSTGKFPVYSPGSRREISVTTSSAYISVGFQPLDSATLICGINKTDVPFFNIGSRRENQSIKRVWLELGDVCHMETTPPKNYAESLSVCQRYYYRIDLNGLAVVPLANGQVVNASTARVILPTPAEMRIKPEYHSNAVVEIRANGVLYSSVSVAVYNIYRNMVALTLTRTGGDNFPTNHLTAFGVHASAAGENAYLELTADL